MKNILICLLLAVLLVKENKASCAEWKKLESDCGSYCLKVLRPVLDHTKALQSQVDDHHTESLTKVEISEKFIHEKLEFLANRMELKLAELHKIINNELIKQNGDVFEKFQNIDALETRLVQRLANQSKSTEAFLSKFEKNLKTLLQENFEIMFEKHSKITETSLQIKNMKSLQYMFETLQNQLNTQFRNMNIQIQGKIDAPDKSMESRINELRKLNKAKKVIVRKPFKEIESKYYYFEDHLKLSWFDAALKCLEYGGHLASFENYDEFYEFPEILENENDSNSEMESYWIDINDLETEGRFLSATTGLQPGYLNWHKGEPNNLDGVEHCVELRYDHHNYKMNDADCEAERYFICESENVYKPRKKHSRGQHCHHC